MGVGFGIHSSIPNRSRIPLLMREEAPALGTTTPIPGNPPGIGNNGKKEAKPEMAQPALPRKGNFGKFSMSGLPQSMVQVKGIGKGSFQQIFQPFPSLVGLKLLLRFPNPARVRESSRILSRILSRLLFPFQPFQRLPRPRSCREGAGMGSGNGLGSQTARESLGNKQDSSGAGKTEGCSGGDGTGSIPGASEAISREAEPGMGPGGP